MNSNEYTTPFVAEDDVTVRPLSRADLDVMRSWGRHSDPLFASYNVPALSDDACDSYWTVLAERPRTRHYAGCYRERFVSHAIVRKIDPVARTADLGISSDPRYIGQGIGRRVIRALARILAHDGIQLLTLDVAGYNRRAIAAYRSAGFEQTALRRLAADDGIDYVSLLASESHAWLHDHLEMRAGIPRVDVMTMEMRLDAELHSQ